MHGHQVGERFAVGDEPHAVQQLDVTDLARRPGAGLQPIAGLVTEELDRLQRIRALQELPPHISLVSRETLHRDTDSIAHQ